MNSFPKNFSRIAHNKNWGCGMLVASLLALAPFATLVAAPATVAPKAAAATDVQFMRDLAPILVGRCTACHGAIKEEGNIRLHTFERLMEGSTPVIVPGHPEKSELFSRLISAAADERMPQEDDALTPAQIDLFRRWILAGAKFDGPDPKAPFKTMFGPREHPAAPATYPSPVPVLALALAPGAKEVAVGGYHEVTIWDTATGRLVRRLGHLPQKIQTLSYNRAGTQLLVGGGTPGDYGELALVDAASGARLRVFDTFADVVLSASFRADGQRVAAGSADQTVRVYDTADGRRLWNQKLHADWVTGVSFSADQRYVASSSKDKTVKLYAAESGELYTTYTGHNKMIGKYAGQNPVYSVKFTPDSPVALSVGGGGWVQLWEPEKAYSENGTAADTEDRFKSAGHARYLAHGATQEVFALAVDKGQVFVASADGLVKQFNLATLGEVFSYVGHKDWVYALDYNGAVERLATGGYDGEIRIWDTISGACLTTFKAIPGQSAATPSAAKVATTASK
jgi:WD40 repeat protein